MVWVGKARTDAGYEVRLSKDSPSIGGLQFHTEDPRGWLTWCSRCPRMPTVTSGHRRRDGALEQLREHHLIEHRP